jgi:hypothetical protein
MKEGRKNYFLFYFCPLFMGLRPLLKTDLATKNPAFMRGCGLLAHLPAFFLY